MIEKTDCDLANCEMEVTREIQTGLVEATRKITEKEEKEIDEKNEDGTTTAATTTTTTTCSESSCTLSDKFVPECFLEEEEEEEEEEDDDDDDGDDDDDERMQVDENVETQPKTIIDVFSGSLSSSSPLPSPSPLSSPSPSSSSSSLSSSSSSPSSSSSLSRKRPAGSDFLSIDSDAKRIGVEMSEEETNQLRNDVKRLSPVEISLRERTLGEISLTPDSRLFCEDVNNVTSENLSSSNVSRMIRHRQSMINDFVVDSNDDSTKTRSKSKIYKIDATIENDECTSSVEIMENVECKLHRNKDNIDDDVDNDDDDDDDDNDDDDDDNDNEDDDDDNSCCSTSFRENEILPCEDIDEVVDKSKANTSDVVKSEKEGTDSLRRLVVMLNRVDEEIKDKKTDLKECEDNVVSATRPRKITREDATTIKDNVYETMLKSSLSSRKLIVVLNRIDMKEAVKKEKENVDGCVDRSIVESMADCRTKIDSTMQKICTRSSSLQKRLDMNNIVSTKDRYTEENNKSDSMLLDNSHSVVVLSCIKKRNNDVSNLRQAELNEEVENVGSETKRAFSSTVSIVAKYNDSISLDSNGIAFDQGTRYSIRNKTKTITDEELGEKEELRVEKNVPRRNSVLQKSNKEEVPSSGAAVVIEKLEEEEEVVLATSSIMPNEEEDDRLQNLDTSDLDSSETTTPGSPEEALEASADVQEAIDTETETETGSDSSEIPTSMPIVRIRDTSCEREDIADAANNCPENETLCCDEIASEMITRLEPEKPEPFTEDSAESLALTAGARDEVRSDGSDSGLGSEIPGDPGPAPAPESDSETSFLDRIPDDILSDKEKAVNQLESFVPETSVPGASQATLATFRNPPKSNLKRRLTDCMEGEPSPKRSNTTEEPMKKKRNIHFDAVTVYYFPRAQGFTCVPSQGGSTLGMSATHTHAERFSLSEHAAEQRRLHRARLAQLRSERAANCATEAASSSEDPSDDTDEEPSDNEELDIDSYYFLQPVPTWQRRALLRAAGVRRIDAVEKDECRDIRASREHCGCGCKGYCDPESCPCSRANVKCQVDRAGFPCGCTRDGCANSSGRIEFNPVRVRTHFIHTLMRLELEKKQREEEGTDHEGTDNQNNKSGPLRDINLGSLIDNSNTEACITGGGFTTLHYENHDAGNGSSNCQPEVPGTREDSLDLYAIRDDCYPNEDTVDGTQSGQRKLHPEFSQAFQTFSGQTAGANMNFQQTAYQDYQAYTNLPSTSRVQFQPQFQPVPGSPGFSHYAVYGQDGTSVQDSCQVHPGQHSSNYEANFAQDESTGSQYTNLNSVQPMNGGVQQIGKLEPFSELLSGRYSYYGEIEPQAHGTYHGNANKEGDKDQTTNEQQSESTEECDENFGEIIKKSMVETVSA
ncbi:AT-rich interactive domain-containing protein 4B isoform X2 [Vespa velutina]|nr:AT-rich interactive domain-containing protein 4B isoform X2 [Vespa velutina]XP_047357851.1 AT-rich interactive domain-containing protein 4B isoform X2 [Vespa velutina]